MLNGSITVIHMLLQVKTGRLTDDMTRKEREGEEVDDLLLVDIGLNKNEGSERCLKFSIY